MNSLNHFKNTLHEINLSFLKDFILEGHDDFDDITSNFGFHKDMTIKITNYKSIIEILSDVSSGQLESIGISNDNIDEIMTEVYKTL